MLLFSFNIMEHFVTVVYFLVLFLVKQAEAPLNPEWSWRPGSAPQWLTCRFKMNPEIENFLGDVNSATLIAQIPDMIVTWALGRFPVSKVDY